LGLSAQRAGGAELDANFKGHNVGYVLERNATTNYEWTQTGDKTWKCINKDTGKDQGAMREDRRGEWGVFLTNTATGRNFQIDLWQKKVFDRSTGTVTFGDILKVGARPSAPPKPLAFRPGNDYYYIVNLSNNRCIDVAASGTGDGTNVGLYGKHGGKNQ